MESLDEWGLGGRGFGTWVTWFLLGGDLYTAYTFIAVPAAMFALGAVSGFFAVPYTIVVYPIIFVFMPRLWSVSHRHGYVTAADFVAGATARAGCRWRSRSPASWRRCPTSPCSWSASRPSWRSSASAATAPWLVDLPLFIAFAVLAAYTYSSGLRAPALIAFVKDALIYLVIIVAVIYLPTKFGGWGHIFDCGPDQDGQDQPGHRQATGAFIPGPTQYWAYATLALGSALALFMYPHSVTAVLSLQAADDDPAQRGDPAGVLASCSACWPCSAGSPSRPAPSRSGWTASPTPQLVIPQLFEDSFPSWFAGVAFAAVAIGALVPAAIMSIAAANLFTRNIYREWHAARRDGTRRRPRSASWSRCWSRSSR